MQRKYILPLFFLIQILFLKIIAFFPEFVERFYSNGLYGSISKISRVTLGKIPFSVGDIIYGIVIIYLLKSIWNTRKTWRLEWKNNPRKQAKVQNPSQIKPKPNQIQPKSNRNHTKSKRNPRK